MSHISPQCKSQPEPSWHRLDWSPHWCLNSTSPSQRSPGELQALGWSWNVLYLRGHPWPEVGTEQRWQQVLAVTHCHRPRSAKPIQVQLQPQREFHKEELALGEGYFKTENQAGP